MARWNKGSEVIERLLEDRHLEEVPADADTAERLIATARRHISSATSNAESDPEGAFALAYDAARKTATALLAHQGLRPTSTGGHIAVADAINAQFPGIEGLKSIDRLRRRRNQAEYPDPRDYDPVTTDEVDDAVAAASACVDAAEKLLAAPQLGLFR
ncbi:MAG: HEPN domain-containing protein [Actinobacteria bacterium]|nr:HEPN domain-containing protein [Actinomycetota bacterium]